MGLTQSYPKQPVQNQPKPSIYENKDYYYDPSKHTQNYTTQDILNNINNLIKNKTDPFSENSVGMSDINRNINMSPAESQLLQIFHVGGDNGEYNDNYDDNYPYKKFNSKRHRYLKYNINEIQSGGKIGITEDSEFEKIRDFLLNDQMSDINPNNNTNPLDNNDGLYKLDTYTPETDPNNNPANKIGNYNGTYKLDTNTPGTEQNNNALLDFLKKNMSNMPPEYENLQKNISGGNIMSDTSPENKMSGGNKNIKKRKLAREIPTNVSTTSDGKEENINYDEDLPSDIIDEIDDTEIETNEKKKHEKQKKNECKITENKDKKKNDDEDENEDENEDDDDDENEDENEDENDDAEKSVSSTSEMNDNDNKEYSETSLFSSTSNSKLNKKNKKISNEDSEINYIPFYSSETTSTENSKHPYIKNRFN